MNHLPKLEIHLLGAPQISYNGVVSTERPAAKAQALLYYLAMTGRPHTRVALATLLWGEHGEGEARRNLRKVIQQLREYFGAYLTIDPQTVGFHSAGVYWVDGAEFASQIAESLAEHPERLQQAIALYQGDFLEGFSVREAPDFEAWMLSERARLRELMLQGVDTLAVRAASQGDLPQAIAWARRLLALEPWREETHRQLMRWLAHNGQRSAALAQFEACRQILAEELAVEPDAETVALVEAIRAGEGVTRWQGDKVNRALDPSVTLSPSHPVKDNLPIPPTPLIGRERELTELGEMISNPQCKLITITGPGGMGKTRLALAAAAEQSGKFQHDAVFVPLAGILSAQFLPQAILSALNIPLQGTLSPGEQVRATLYNQERLLLLDNYEHLLPDVELLLDLLHYAPHVTLLVTSRERLALQAEYLFETTGLDYPHDQSTKVGTQSTLNLAGYAASQLFLQRVRQTQPRFTPNDQEMAAIARICCISEGAPLALELAAAATRVQSTMMIAEALERRHGLPSVHMRDLPQRHHTLQAVFEHSWQLLSPFEQCLFARLSIFRGNFMMEAANHVAGASLTLLSALIDKSLLRRTSEVSFEMHELTRQFAVTKLEVLGEFDTIRERHAAYFVALAEEELRRSLATQFHPQYIVR